jgi:hypothetical protein
LKGVGKLEKWENLIKILEKYEENAEFVAGCVYGYLAEVSPEDENFIDDLLEFMEVK